MSPPDARVGRALTCTAVKTTSDGRESARAGGEVRAVIESTCTGRRGAARNDGEATMYRGLSCIIALLCMFVPTSLAHAQAAALPPLLTASPQAINLLRNSGFEDVEASAWGFSDWPPREETGARLIADSIRFSDEQAFEGERCLVLDLTTVGTERILIAQQKLSAEDLAPWDGSRMRLSARVLLGTGPTAQRVGMTLRQWGEDGLLDHQSVRMTADVNEWAEGSREFVLRMGATTRADVNVTVRQSPDLTNSPIVYLDEVRLEALSDPPLQASLPWGRVLPAPDDTLPLAVRISQEAWDAEKRGLRWDITDPGGAHSLAHGELTAQTRMPVLSIDVSELTEGRHALRLALGAEPGERWREVLVQFTRAEGPLDR